MKDTAARVIDTSVLESRFVFSKTVYNTFTMIDDEGFALSFLRCDNGNQIVFTKDLDGVDVAIEHCVDGGKIFHLTQDSKGLPAMHEFKADGTEIMYLLDKNTKLEKLIENKTNGDKLTTWFYAEEVVMQEQRQKGGIVFRLVDFQGEATIWLQNDGTLIASGNDNHKTRLQTIFGMYLDGAEVQ